MRGYSSRKVISLLRQAGWFEVASVGSHHQFKHPTKPGRATVKHPCKSIPVKTLRSIERQAGMRFDETGKN